MRRRLLVTALLATLALGAHPAYAVDAPPATDAPLQVRADAGDAGAMLDLGRQLLAPGAQRDEVRGLFYLEQAARGPLPAAAYANTALGGYYASRTDAASRAASLRYWRTAASMGDTAAQVSLARAMLGSAMDGTVTGMGGEAVKEQALLLLNHAATHGNADAMWELGNAYHAGRIVTVDGNKAREWLGKAADAGNLQAAYVLGAELTRDTNALFYDPLRGRQYLERAANGGNRQAMSTLADALYAGKPWPRDLAAALRWATMGKAAGDSGALARLSRIEEAIQTDRINQATAKAAAEAAAARQVVRVDTDVDRDPGSVSAPVLTGSAEEQIQALARYTEQLREQNERLQRQMARLAGGEPASSAPAPISQAAALNQQGLIAYQSGDFRTAIRYFATAQRAGDVDAANNLAMIYLRGQGTAVNTVRAVQLFRVAAEAGHATAASNLAYLYENGIGVPQDSSRALVWATRARQSQPVYVQAARVQRRIASAVDLDTEDF